MSYEAFVLTPEARNLILLHYKPVYPDFIGHHVTHVFGGPFTSEDHYGRPYVLTIYGHAARNGVEAFVVKVGTNQTVNRPDGKLYHLTWSIDRAAGKKPVDSNVLVAAGFDPVTPELSFPGYLQLIK